MLKRVRRNRSISLNQNGLTASISVSPFGSVIVTIPVLEKQQLAIPYPTLLNVVVEVN
jgi:hypothetical protein